MDRWPGAGRHVEILRLDAKVEIPDATADEVGLVADFDLALETATQKNGRDFKGGNIKSVGKSERCLGE